MILFFVNVNEKLSYFSIIVTATKRKFCLFVVNKNHKLEIPKFIKYSLSSDFEKKPESLQRPAIFHKNLLYVEVTLTQF